MIEKIDHVAIAVKDLDQAVKIFEQALGLEVKTVETFEEVKMRICFIPVGEVLLELLEDTDPGGMISQFISEKGEGLHHIAYRVTNVEKTLEHLKKSGLKLRNEKPIQGGAGAQIAFVERESTNNVLTEIVERKEDR